MNWISTQENLRPKPYSDNELVRFDFEEVLFWACLESPWRSNQE